MPAVFVKSNTASDPAPRAGVILRQPLLCFRSQPRPGRWGLPVPAPALLYPGQGIYDVLVPGTGQGIYDTLVPELVLLH